MLKFKAPFPFNGCKAFLAGSADPVTVIRRNADGTSLVRMDDKPFAPASRDASGNRTVDKDDLHKTEEAAVKAGLPKRRKARAAK